MQVKRTHDRDNLLDKAMKKKKKKLLSNTVTTLAEVCQAKRLTKAVPVARAVDFFTNLRKIWGDWDKIKRRILGIMGNYYEREDEKLKIN